MKKNILLSLITLFIALTINAQEWKKYLPRNKTKQELTLFDYQKAFKEYEKTYKKTNGISKINGEEKTVPGYKQFKRWEWYWKQIVDPVTGEFPKKYPWDIIKKHKKTHPEMYRNANENWHNIGATTTTNWNNWSGLGCVQCIGFHPTNPNIFWVGSLSGGLWKTTDGGQNYTPLTDNIGFSHIFDIYVPSNFDTTQTLYIVVDDHYDEFSRYTKKLFRSRDAGLTWTELNPAGLPNNHLYDNFSFRYEKNNPNTIYAVMTYDDNSSYNAPYKSIDGGDTWTNISNDANASAIVTAQALHPTNYNIGYKFGSYGRFYKTIDGGQTWVLKATFNGGTYLYSQHIAICESQPNVIYACVGTHGHLGGLFKSTDGGETFTQIVDNTSNYWGVAGVDSPRGFGELYVNPNNPDDVITGSKDGYRSLDGGVTWSRLQGSHVDKQFYAIQPVTGFLFEGNDGGIVKYETNYGPSINLSQGLAISEIYKIGTSPTHENEMLYGTQDNGTFGLNSNTNYQWKEIWINDGMDCAIDPNNPNIQYASYQWGQYERTVDKWLSHTNISQNFPSGFAGRNVWLAPIVLHPSDSDTFWVLNRHDIIKTTDGGNTFTSLGNANIFAISKTNPEIQFKGYNQVVYKSTDNGINWASLTINENITQINNITISENDPNTVWILIRVTGNTSKVIKTIDGGQTWVDITGNLPNLKLSALVYNKQYTAEDEIYIGSVGGGLYVKRGNDDWVAYMSGLSSASITDMEIYYDTNPSNSKIRIGTYGRGLWESVLYDGSLSSVDNSRIDNISIFPNPTNNTLKFKNGKLIKKVILLNLLGQKILNYTNEKNTEFSIDISNLTKGTYILNIIFKNGEKQIKKIIKD